ncbi:electron transport complex subunit RsxC [Porticoccaceae bacterium LTM1]|nr:electron transport complex subunit RsxC [Porticoccaceae bacterium LTM1]
MSKTSTRRIWDIPGGIHPPERKTQSLGHGIGTLPLPPQLIVPLNQHNGQNAIATVNIGDKVLKGQTIAEPSGALGSAIHAPTSGRIVAMESQPVPHPSGLNALVMVIEPDGEEQWIERQPIADFRNREPAELVSRIRESGISGLGGAGFPTAVKLSPPVDHPISTLIINATECEPYITADDILMQSHPQQVVEGIQILAHILGNPENVLIGIEDNKTAAYDALLPHLEGTNIELVEFPTKYPSGGERQLIQILTGQELPNGKLPADIGIICQNVGTAHAIYRAVAEGTPLISRITTVTGEACKVQRNFETLIGTPIDFVLEQCGYDAGNSDRVVMGGPMMGFALPDTSVPVIKTTNCILAPSRSELPEAPPAQPCIRCGACAEACPAGLLPQQLFWYAQANDYERLQTHNLFDCIECGACAYTCPSHIPLVQYYRAAKGEMRQQAQEKIKADRARERFEFNKARKQQAEAEKAAKREARRLAAEQAKAKLAEQQTSGDNGSAASDVVQAALAQVQAKKVTPEQQRAKLERSVSSAESRLQRLEQKLADGQATDADPALTPEQVDGYRAQIESARHKHLEAQQKLADFDNNGDSASRARQKVLASPRQTLEAKVESLEKQLRSIDEKIANCDDEALREALNNSRNKFLGKLSDARSDLLNLGNDADQPVTDVGTITATDRALASTAASAAKSAEQRLQADIDRLQQRISKVQQQLAESDESMQEALQTSIERMRQKLATAEAKLAEQRTTTDTPSS